MYWVYLIKCENKRYYIGYSRRLYKRLNKLKSNCTILDTYNHCSIYKPKYLFGLYDVRKNLIYKEYSKLLSNLNDVNNINDYNFSNLKEIIDHFDKYEYDNFINFDKDDVKNDALIMKLHYVK